MGRTCETNFDGTCNRLLKLRKARKKYEQTTGKVCPTDLLSEVLNAFADDETTDKMDKEDACKWEKQPGRTTVNSHERSNKMGIGAFQAPSASEAPATSPTTADNGDPTVQWDPWACGPCSGEQWPAD